MHVFTIKKIFMVLLVTILTLGKVIAQSNPPVAIPMKYHVVENKQKFIALAGYSDNITYTAARYGDNPIQWSTRYKDAITDWSIQSLPSNGTLYDQSTVISSTPYSVPDPDELLYVPNNGYTGNDAFTFRVTDAIGTSNTATISLIVESAVTMPAGIPSLPSIFNTVAPTPATSGSTETNDWYIDNTHPNATDAQQSGESNPRHGTPDRPRSTIPPNNVTFVAGARVFIAGGVTTPYTLRSGISWHQWICPGTSGSPIYIIGVNNGPNKPIITDASDRSNQQLRLQAQYTIIEGINFKGAKPDHRDGQSGGNVVLRHCIIDGLNLATAGSALGLNIGTHNVYYDLHLKRVGFTEPDLSDENDVHGIIISTDNIWVMDNLIHGCAGDAMQLIGSSSANRYIGRNKLHSDNENAMDLKGRYDLIFVENDCWDYRGIEYASSGSDGAPVIVNVDKYGAPTRATIARNRIWDANAGVRHQGTYIWTTDNVFWHIHHNTNTGGEAYAVVVGNNGATGYVDRITNNTFHKVDGGVRIWAGSNTGINHQYKGNNFGELNSNSNDKFHWNINSEHDQDTKIDYNNYSSAALIEWAGTLRSLSWMQANTTNSVNDTENRDPQFIDAANFDLSIQSTSPLIDDNIQHSTYQEFFDEYGLSIKYDAANEIRPQGSNWDIGAYEYATGTFPTEYTLTVSATGGSVTPGGGAYVENTVLTLTATPSSGYEFTGWSGDLSGTTNPIQLTMNSNKTVTANFTALPQYTVTVNTLGNGSATLNPPGGTYLVGTTVILTATPDAGNEFDNWSGDFNSDLSPVAITVNSNMVINANISTQSITIEELGVSSVNASHQESANPAPNTLDNNLGTRWSGFGDGAWIRYDLGETLTISYLSIAWYNGNSRIYPFEIEVSSDDSTWTQVYTGSSSGTSTEQQVADFADVSGRYVRIVCHGYDNGGSLWNSITEVDVYGFGGTPPLQYSLTANSLGNGSVSSDPGGGVYDSATVVTLTAVPDSGYVFSNWSGDFSGTDNPAQIVMDSDKNITANFVLEPIDAELLTVSSVTASSQQNKHRGPEKTLDNNLNTQWAAKGDGEWICYDLGKLFTVSYLSIAWDKGTEWTYNFDIEVSKDSANWNEVFTGLSSGTTIQHEVYDFEDLEGRYVRIVGHGNNTSNQKIQIAETDIYGGPVRYTLTISSLGSGNVTPESGVYNEGAEVTLTALPETGWQFDNWSGDLSGTTNPSVIIMDGNKSVTANFSEIMYSLNVSTVGNGSVTQDPLDSTYVFGSIVTLTATADTGWQFDGWSGDLADTTNPVNLTMDADKNVTATFSQIMHALTVNVEGNGGVALNPAGGVYAHGTVVTVTATPDSGWQFDGWSGDLSDTTNPATITIDAGKTITATFSEQSNVAWTLIQYDDFEEGLGNYFTLNNSELYTGGTFAHQGNNAVRIWDNKGAHSAINSLSAGFSVEGYEQLRIEFWLYTVNMDNPSVDRLEVFYRPGNASSQLVASFYYETDFVNDEFTKLTVILNSSEYAFLNKTRLQFISRAEDADDSFYIDEIAISGGFSLAKKSAANAKAELIPDTYSLANYPNPFNPSTIIQYGLPEAGHVELTIYDIIGRKVADVFKGNKGAGTYRYTWNAKDNNGRELSSGVYFLSISSKDFHKTIKMMYLR